MWEWTPDGKKDNKGRPMSFHRFLAMPLAASLWISCPGCSFFFVKPVPENYHPSQEPECNGPDLVIWDGVLGLLLLGGATMEFIGAAIVEPCQGGEAALGCLFVPNPSGMIRVGIVGVIASALFATSMATGIHGAGDCRDARKRHRRWIEDNLQRSGPANTIAPHEVNQVGSSLAWQRCASGATWNGIACEGTPRETTWDEAVISCPADSRLPTRAELVSLLDGCDLEARNGGKNGYCRPCEESSHCRDLFGPDRGRYWSSASAFSTSRVWAVNFRTGVVDFEEKSASLNVRCVRRLGPRPEPEH